MRDAFAAAKSDETDGPKDVLGSRREAEGAGKKDGNTGEGRKGWNKDRRSKHVRRWRWEARLTDAPKRYRRLNVHDERGGHEPRTRGMPPLERKNEQETIEPKDSLAFVRLEKPALPDGDQQEPMLGSACVRAKRQAAVIPNVRD